MSCIHAVIFDWAGTTVDYGCFAPVKGFIDGFASIGHGITDSMAREPMGLPKLEHVRAIAKRTGSAIPEEKIRKAYEVFESTLLGNIGEHCDIKDFVADTANALRGRGIQIGSTTGYTSEMMEVVLRKAQEQGYCPDFWVTPDQVGKGRPYPYMIWENMKRFGLSDAREIVKIGDTTVDILEGKNANCWTVGVIMGSSELGLSRGEVAALSEEQLGRERLRVRAAYYEAGADYIINDLDELLSVVDDINRKLAQSAMHKLLTPGPLSTRHSVKQAMLTDHCTWDDEYKAITSSVMEDITAISANDDYAAVLLQGSGSYAVEAMINCLTGKDEKILFLVNGEYGNRMLRIARSSGKVFEALFFDETKAVEVSELEKKLAETPDIGAVVAVHCETTTGVINPLEELVKTARKHGKKVLVDAMSSFAAYEIDMPGLDIDALASSANKCLEGLPGLSFVIAKKTLLEQSENRSLSHSLDLYDQYKGLSEGNGKFRFTSPTNILLALRQAIDEYKKEGGLKARRERYRKNHSVLVDGLGRLGIKPIVDRGSQSYIITTFELGDLDFNEMYHELKANGFILYPGKLTKLPTFRLGNIGDVYPADMEALVNAVGAYRKKRG
jgi:2-aminoethylphosphonate--pyruvate transaminase/phosphonoacetaldehyde hydrolase